jgi:DNA-binding MarR family transcriptional regulator
MGYSVWAYRGYKYVDMPRYQHVDTPAELTPEHLDRLISAVKSLGRHGIDERLWVFGMSAVHCQALQLIWDYPGLSQRQLAKLMGQSEQAFGTLLARLLTGGYLVRRRARGRALTHELTAHGRVMLHAAKEIGEDVLALLFVSLTGRERRFLRLLLQKVLDARWRLRLLPSPESS